MHILIIFIKFGPIIKITLDSMYKILTPVLIALAIILLPSATLSQTISYAYDGSGNRIKREILMNANKMPGSAGVDDILQIEKDI